MNINDVENVPQVEDKLIAIINKQKELMSKYQQIEGMPNYPMDIDSKESQKWFKDFFWRIIEEIMEAYECISHKEHFEEEIGDAFHFLIEALILINTNLDFKIDSHEDSSDMLDELFMATLEYDENVDPIKPLWEVCYRLGLAANCLKNKPWKCSQMLTDKNKFNSCMNEVLLAFISMCKFFNMNADDLYNTYWKKSEVNKFRIRSNY